MSIIATPTLPEIRTWCAQARPVFIGGLARSGTTMLLVALSHHPALFDLPAGFETHLLAHPQDAMQDPVRMSIQCYLRGADHLAAYRALVRRLAAQHADFEQPDHIRVFFWYASHHVYPGRQPLEKTPANVRQIPLLFELFPHARFIVCSRDPVEVAASYRKRLAKSREVGIPEERLGWLNQPVERLLEIFDRYTRKVQAARTKHGPQMFMAPYEWVTASPEAALRQICAFAGLPFDAALLNLEPNDANAVSDPAVAEKLVSVFNMPDQIMARDSQAASWLTCAEIDNIEHATQRWMPLWRTPGPLG